MNKQTKESNSCRGKRRAAASKKGELRFCPGTGPAQGSGRRCRAFQGRSGVGQSQEHWGFLAVEKPCLTQPTGLQERLCRPGEAGKGNNPPQQHSSGTQSAQPRDTAAEAAQSTNTNPQKTWGCLTFSASQAWQELLVP